MRDWFWTPPTSWPFPSSPHGPGADFWPDFDQLPPADADHDWWRPVGGMSVQDIMANIEAGARGERVFDTPPDPPQHPPLRWVPPPTWPRPEPGWAPPLGWKPRGLPRAPKNWVFWQKNFEPHEAEVRAWHLSRLENTERTLAIAAGQAAWLDGAERLLNYLRASFFVQRRPIGVVAAFIGGDISVARRAEQYEAYRHALEAGVDFRARVLAVARGTHSVVDVQLVQSSITCVHATRRTFAVDGEIVLEMLSLMNDRALKSKDAAGSAREAQLPMAQGQMEFLERIQWAHVWAYGERLDDVEGGPLASWQDAEKAAARHMRGRLGFVDATVTPPGNDNGIDVRSERAVAQVKYYSKPVGQPDVQRLVGANESRLEAIFYALSGFTSKAVEYADRAGVALFRFDPPGAPVAVNDRANLMLRKV